ncbi:MAG: hypothetical protein OXU66_11420 [Gammaproteobacteria bacterium]|nr:hypothetical protein [Gammaproteobacteria bacterium]MDD9896245.1 hypothetical protein [Gammaproteobacteria bacterium]MDD9959539.1 hypothetical protein [Gammaproteobacteria bacterium]
MKKSQFLHLTLLSLLLSNTVLSQEIGCDSLAGFDQFDFWVGEWEVFESSGTIKVGENSIQKMEAGCMIMESWTSAQGDTGTSLNYFNPVTNEWRQVWVSAGRYSIDIVGGIRAGAMVLEGSIYNFAGAVWDFRGTWIPNSDGSVRQFFEQYNHDSEQWDPWFNGLYKKKEG